MVNRVQPDNIIDTNPLVSSAVADNVNVIVHDNPIQKRRLEDDDQDDCCIKRARKEEEYEKDLEFDQIYNMITEWKNLTSIKTWSI